jgi:hypothetical protein
MKINKAAIAVIALSAFSSTAVLTNAHKASAATCQQLAEQIVRDRQEMLSWDSTENYGVFTESINLVRSYLMETYRSRVSEYYARCAYYTPLPAVQPSSPPPFNNLISDSGRLKLQRNGHNLSYFYSAGGKTIQGYVNVFTATSSKVRGMFKDSNGYGCKGEVVFEKVRSSRWISTWDIQPFKPGDKCDGATTKTMLTER